jgi:hypothetical protein
LAHLASALFAFDAKERLMAFITGYFDESSDAQTNSPLVYTVAGYVSTDVKWLDFQKEWKAVLDRENLLHFSMKELSKIKKSKNWTIEQETSFLQELHSIIKKTYLCGFSVSLILNDYNSFSDEIKSQLGSPHFLTTAFLMLLISSWTSDNNLKEPILYVFEKGDEGKDNDLDFWFNEIFTPEMRNFFRIESFAFREKKFTPLQSADILAYETRKDINRRYLIEKPRDMRKSLENIIDWTQNRWAIVDKVTLEWFINGRFFNNNCFDKELSERMKLAKKKGWL